MLISFTLPKKFQETNILLHTTFCRSKPQINFGVKPLVINILMVSEDKQPPNYYIVITT